MDEKVQEPKTQKNIRDSLYKNIDISVKSMDKFIVAMLILLVLALGFAILTK